MKRFFGISVLLLTIAGLVEAESARPNIILIMADDFGYELVGANGGASFQTPVLELSLPMDVQLVAGHPRIEEARNQARVKRGPVVYCQERQICR